MKHLPIPIKALRDNYIWAVVVHPKQFIVIDPGDAEPILNFARLYDYQLTAVLITHHHPDHVFGIKDLIQYFPRLKIFTPMSLDVPHTIIKTQLKIASLKFAILITPGHTPEGICYYEPKKQWLFCGDTLFSAGCGRVTHGSHEQLYQSLVKLKKLPDTTLIFPAHEYTRQNLEFAFWLEPSNLEIKKTMEYFKAHPNKITVPSSIAVEKKINPFFHCDSIKLQQNLRQRFNLPDSDELSIFKFIRNQKDKF